MLYPACRTGLKQIRVGPRGEKGNRLVAYEAIGWFCGQHGGAMISLVSFTSYICMPSIQKTKERKCCSCLSWPNSNAFRPMVVRDRRAVGGSITPYISM